jgi:hypothetical protein
VILAGVPLGVAGGAMTDHRAAMSAGIDDAANDPGAVPADDHGLAPDPRGEKVVRVRDLAGQSQKHP